MRSCLGQPRRGGMIVENRFTPRKQAPKGRNSRKDDPIEIAAHRGADQATPSGFRFQPTRFILQSCHPFGIRPASPAQENQLRRASARRGASCHPFGISPGIPSARKSIAAGFSPPRRIMPSLRDFARHPQCKKINCGGLSSRRGKSIAAGFSPPRRIMSSLRDFARHPPSRPRI